MVPEGSYNDKSQRDWIVKKAKMLVKDPVTDDIKIQTKQGLKIPLRSPEDVQNIVNQSLMRLDDTYCRSSNVFTENIIICRLCIDGL